MSEAGWGTDKPKVAGWYWYKPSPDPDYAEVLLILGDGSDECPLFAMQNGVGVTLSRLGGEWLGPITPDAYAAGRVATCVWTYDDIDDCYNTGCGNAYCLVDGTLEENEHTHCPYCGGQIEAQGGEHV